MATDAISSHFKFSATETGTNPRFDRISLKIRFILTSSILIIVLNLFNVPKISFVCSEIISIRKLSLLSARGIPCLSRIRPLIGGNNSILN